MLLFSLTIFLVIFSLACFVVRMQYIIHIMYKMCVHQLYVSVRPPVNSRLLVVSGELEVVCGFLTVQGMGGG